MNTSNVATGTPRFARTFQGWNLGSRLIFWFSLLFLGGLSLIFYAMVWGIPYTYFDGRIHQLRTETFKTLDLIATLHKERIESWLTDKQRDLRIIAKTSLLRDGLSHSVADPESNRMFLYLQMIAREYPEFEFLEVVDLARQMVFSSTGVVKRHVVKDSFLHYTLLSPRGYVGRVRMHDDQHGKQGPMFRIGHPVHDVDGRAVAILVAAVNPEVLLARLHSIGDGLGSSGEVLLVDDHVVLISKLKHRFPDGTVSRPMVSQLKGKPAVLAAAGHEGIDTALDYRGEPVIASFRHLRLNPVWGMGLVVKMDEQELFAPLKRELYSIIGSCLLLFCLLVLLNAYMVRRQTAVLHLLSNSAARFSGNDLTVRTGIQGNDELSILGRSFDLMADRIQSSFHELECEVVRHRQTTLELSQINEELKNFSYIVSHDLRSPLLSIQGFSEEMQMDLEALDQVLTREMVHADVGTVNEINDLLRMRIPGDMRYIRSSTHKMEGLTNAILNLSRLGRTVLQFERIDLQSLVENNIKALGYTIKELGITVSVAPLPHLISDRFAMEQIIGNLLSNAIKYLEPTRPGVIQIYGAQSDDGRQVTLWVKDNGRGIAQEDIERIFVMFQRVGRQDTVGDGIGLACVRTLVRRLEGHIDCESTLGSGTVFKVTLPSIPSDAGSV
ncbi:MAG: sensor histidine kinase [Magnetococcales bacterium]|nr:sensor histidine kinase [Magnetococcales bacterium]